jgi:hypothetical protein
MTVPSPDQVARALRYVAELLERDPSRVDLHTGRIATHTQHQADLIAAGLTGARQEEPLDDLPGPIWIGVLGRQQLAVRAIPDDEALPAASLVGLDPDFTPRLLNRSHPVTMTDRIDIGAAQPTGGIAAAPTVIRILNPVPDFTSLDEARSLYRDQARLLADALYRSLPGGTLDALYLELTERRLSLLRVANPSPKEPA